jgi:hypothetical protein
MGPGDPYSWVQETQINGSMRPILMGPGDPNQWVHETHTHGSSRSILMGPGDPCSGLQSRGEYKLVHTIFFFKKIIF